MSDPVVRTDATARHARPARASATSRAGRNLPQAIAVGVALGALVLSTLAIDKTWFGYVIAAAMAVGAWEMRQALAHRGIRVPLVPVALGSILMILGALARGAESLVVAFGLTALAIVVWRLIDGVDGAARDAAGGIFVSLYPGFLGGFAAMMLAEDDGIARTVVFILTTVCSDIGGYAVGVTLGKHPMAPKLSPKKSWEGFAGSVAACAIAGGTTVTLLLHGSWLGGAGLGVLVAGCATVGDLMESSIKRDLGIKDMSNLLPGHGGLMDRLDSLVMTAPVCWALLLVLAPVS
ncbi:MAG: phosphatidate cytidylyltransferase [Dermatophilaceae bacterium]